MAAKTPSQSRQETLDNIHMIVGQIAEAEELSSISLEDIDDKLGKNGIEEVILGIDIMTDSLVTAANMLVAIAGYLLGEKGINEKTAFSQLTGKIQNTSPIIGNVPIGSGEGVGNPASEGIIDIIISGIDNNGLEKHIEIDYKLDIITPESDYRKIEFSNTDSTKLRILFSP